MRLWLALALALLTASGAWADMPEIAWLSRQKGLSVLSRSASRVVFRVQGSGDGVFTAYRARLAAQRWNVVDSVWSGSLRYLRVRRDSAVVDVTLQNAKTAGKLTIAAGASGGQAAISDRIIGDDEVTRTVECSGGALAVNGSSCEITVHGSCSIVRINGNHNTVTIDASAASILVRGNDNYVRWRRRRSASAPIITNLGQYNDVKSY